MLAFAEDDAQLEKLASVRATLPALRDVFLFAALDDLEAEGRAHRAEHPDAVEDASSAIGEDDLATLIYTSGTTGPPKGCMLTHKNLVAAALRVDPELEEESDVILLFLPLAHSFGRLVHQSAAHYGATVAFVAEATRVPEALQTVRPTVLPAVPRVYEKIHSNALGEIERSGGAKRAIGRWALRVGADASRRRRAGKPVPALLHGRSASPTGSSSTRSGSGSAAGSVSASPARRRSASTSSSSSTRSDCSWSRATGSPRPRARRP